jgi:AraC family transcriptional regulator
MQREIAPSPLSRAIWFIESHLEDEIALEDIATASGVSRFHLTRSFSFAFGQPVMRYQRARRLSEAAKRLADGADGILDIALTAGYGSHEAFTRAFKGQFGITPEAVRESRCLEKLKLVEAFAMSTIAETQIEPVRIVDREALQIAGLKQHYDCADMSGIPAQWQKFNAYAGTIPGEKGEHAYGICYNTDEAGNMDYLCGVEVSDFSDLPEEFDRLRIPAGTYVVFRHDEHIAGIQSTWAAVFSDWLPRSGRKLADAPVFERYGPEFDPRNGTGGLELWIPLERS